jgi:hypothetical protein
LRKMSGWKVEKDPRLPGRIRTPPPTTLMIVATDVRRLPILLLQRRDDATSGRISNLPMNGPESTPFWSAVAERSGSEAATPLSFDNTNAESKAASPLRSATALQKNWFSLRARFIDFVPPLFLAVGLLTSVATGLKWAAIDAPWLPNKETAAVNLHSPPPKRKAKILRLLFSHAFRFPVA